LIFRFSGYSLDLDRRELRCNAGLIDVGPQVFDLLVYLIRNRDRVVSKDDLLDAVWEGRVVSESTLTSRINAARRAIGDTGADQALIKTIARKGFRFIGEVEESAKSPPQASPVGVEEAARGLRQEIQFCAAPDGARIAYAVVGKGPPLVKTANWLNHLEYDWQSPVWGHVLRAFAARYRLIRYDERGNGLSDWDVEDISFEAFVSDLETVVDANGLERFPLLGVSQGCAVSIAYAVRHPERVSKLVLYGGYTRGRRRRGQQGADQADALLTLMRQGWGQDNPAFRQMYTSLFVGSTTCSV
jgi:DNA-binding winged helix-turn-helix (wHTH) protein